MKITVNEKNAILQNANFLVKMGYTVEVNDYIIVYSRPENQIIITFEPYSDVSDMSIKFLEKNEFFSIGWIVFVQSDLKLNVHKRLDNILSLLNYLSQNYESITDYNYCLESNKLIDDFIDKNRK